MAITSSTLRIYKNSTLVRTVTTSGPLDAIDVDNLQIGTEYKATVTVTDSNSLTSDESAPYTFRTLPDVDFNEQPFSAGTAIYFDVSADTNDVAIAQCGVLVSLSSSLTDPIRVLSDQPDFRDATQNLQPNTTYYVAPCVIDIYGRTYVNIASLAAVLTTASAPTVVLSDIVPTSTGISGTVTVASLAPLTNLTVRVLPAGGGAYIDAVGLLLQTGSQQWSVSGLSTGTVYNIYATAYNGGGSGTDTAQTETLAVTASVSLEDFSIDPQRNTDSVYVEVDGNVSSGATIDTVGVRFHTEPSRTSQIVADSYGQQGEDYLITTVRNLPSGTTFYAYAYMDYIYQGDTYTLYGEWDSIATVPTITVTSANPSYDGCNGTYTVGGNTVTSFSIKYKPTSGNTWQNATASNGTYTITGLSQSTSYDIKGEITNASGTYTSQTTSFTTLVQPQLSLQDTSTINNGTLYWSADFDSTYTMVSGTVTACKDDEEYFILGNSEVTFSGRESGTVRADNSINIGVDTCVVIFKAIDANGNKFEKEYWI